MWRWSDEPKCCVDGDLELIIKQRNFKVFYPTHKFQIQRWMYPSECRSFSNQHISGLSRIRWRLIHSAAFRYLIPMNNQDEAEYFAKLEENDYWVQDTVRSLYAYCAPLTWSAERNLLSISMNFYRSLRPFWVYSWFRAKDRNDCRDESKLKAFFLSTLDFRLRFPSSIPGILLECS